MKYTTKIKYIVRDKDSGFSDINTGQKKNFNILSSAFIEIDMIKKYIDWYTDNYRAKLPKNKILEDVFIEFEILGDNNDLLDWDCIYTDDKRKEQ